jgi:hypothetical protein
MSAPGWADEQAAKIEFYKRLAFERGEALERVYCHVLFNLDEPDPDYGWPTGDHSPETMAQAIIDKQQGQCELVEQLLARVRELELQLDDVLQGAVAAVFEAWAGKPYKNKRRRIF